MEDKAMKIEHIEGGVTAAKGFEAAAVEAAIKYKNRKDMALIYSTAPCKAAGTFTTNVVKAAPVMWDKKLVEEYFRKARAGLGQNRRSSKAAYDYYKSMSGTNYPQNRQWDSKQ